jgi:hypothetical protein
LLCNVENAFSRHYSKNRVAGSKHAGVRRQDSSREDPHRIKKVSSHLYPVETPTILSHMPFLRGT